MHAKGNVHHSMPLSSRCSSARLSRRPQQQHPHGDTQPDTHSLDGQTRAGWRSPTTQRRTRRALTHDITNTPCSTSKRQTNPQPSATDRLAATRLFQVTAHLNPDPQPPVRTVHGSTRHAITAERCHLVVAAGLEPLADTGVTTRTSPISPSTGIERHRVDFWTTSCRYNNIPVGKKQWRK